MGLRRRPRRRGDGHLTLAEAHLRAQCAALDQRPEPAADAIPDRDDEVIDVAALERERLFDEHPRARRHGRGARGC